MSGGCLLTVIGQTLRHAQYFNFYSWFSHSYFSFRGVWMYFRTLSLHYYMVCSWFRQATTRTTCLQLNQLHIMQLNVVSWNTPIPYLLKETSQQKYTVYTVYLINRLTTITTYTVYTVYLFTLFYIIYLHCYTIVELQLTELNVVERIGANYGANCDWPGRCHVTSGTWHLRANHISPHSGPILSIICSYHFLRAKTLLKLQFKFQNKMFWDLRCCVW